MDGGSAFRRSFHLASPVFLGYYLVPDDLGAGLTKTAVTLLFLGTAWCIEMARMALGLRLIGMRAYEGQRISAYAQGSVGLAFALFVIGDPRIVIPVFVGMAWIDPLAHVARKRGWSRAVPAGAYAALFLAAAAIIEPVYGGFPTTIRLLFAAVATVTAIAVEGPFLHQLDDDLLMQVVPMTILAGLAYAVAAYGLL
jgi:hypothetical protein